MDEAYVEQGIDISFRVRVNSKNRAEIGVASIEQMSAVGLSLRKCELVREDVSLAECFCFDSSEKTCATKFFALKFIFLTI